MPDMSNAALHALQDSLKRESAVYDTLLALAAQQQDALIARRTDDLAAIAHRQATVLNEADGVEEATRCALASLGEALGLPAPASLSEAAARLAPEEANALCALRDRIAETADQLARTNDINKQLLESAMDAIRFTVQLLGDAARPSEPGYASPAPAPEPERRAAALVLDQLA